MDGLKRPEDIERRFFSFVQCYDCIKWTLVDRRKNNNVCGEKECGSSNLDTSSYTSERSFNPDTKRKPKRGR